MSPGPSIEVCCSCGQRYHADPAHQGRAIRCRCGRTLTIPPPHQAPRHRAAPAGRKPPGRFSGPGSVREILRRAWRGAGISARLHRYRRPVTLAAWGYLVAVSAYAGLLWTVGDAWWLATALLFGPRWPILIPFPLLLVAALLVRPALLVPLFLALGVAWGPAMGYRLGWRGWFADDRGDLRVVTFNINAGPNFRTLSIPQDLERFDPDVILLQECDSRLAERDYWPEGWTFRFDEGMCLGSRFPVRETTREERIETGEVGGTGSARLYRLAAPHGMIDLVGVHLETPRKGLESLRYGADASRMEPSTLVRDIGSRRISRWVRQHSKDAIVAGDFNMPVESAIYRRNWGDCTNAFSRVGRGFGYTRILRRFSVRIDHVLSCGGWVPVRAFVGPDLGSDHLPVIVDLRRRD